MKTAIEPGRLRNATKPRAHSRGGWWTTCTVGAARAATAITVNASARPRKTQVQPSGATMYLVAPLGWTWVFLGLALAFTVMAVAALAAPTVQVVHQPPREWARGFVAFLSRPGSIAIFAFVLIYRMDFVAVGPMIKPFWLDRGMTPNEIGTVSTNLGMALGILGAVLGGLFTSRFGIFKGLWILGIAQALPNLGYACVAQFSLGRPYLYAVSMGESFGAGLVTAAFLSFLMRISDKRQ